MADAASHHSGVSGGAASAASVATSRGGGSTYMSQEEQVNRRKQIKGIMLDPTMSQQEKSRTIQSLMDGRSIASRRSSIGSSRAPTASVCSSSGGGDNNNNGHGNYSHYSHRSSGAGGGSGGCNGGAGAAGGYTSDHDGDTVMSDAAPGDIYGYSDMRSVASSISCTSRSIGSNGEVQEQDAFAPGTYRQLHGRSYSLQEWTSNDFGVTTAAGVGVPGAASEHAAASLHQQGGGGGGGHPAALAAFAAANTNIFSDHPQHGDNSRWMEQSRPPCDHYIRNCTIVAPCCGLAFGCRICHDDCPILPPPIKYRTTSCWQTTTKKQHCTASVGLPKKPKSAAAQKVMAKKNKKQEHSDDDDNEDDDADNTEHAYNEGDFDDDISDDDSEALYLQEQQRQLNKQGQQHNILWWAEKMSHKQKQQERRRNSMPLEGTSAFGGGDHSTFYAAGGIMAGDEEYHHQIDRFAIAEVICRKCYKRQSSKTNKCNSCGIVFSDYHCSICNLWMSADEQPYHCLSCGFCRVGGRENFKHCDDCGMCIDALLFDNHNCKAGKYDANCPVCQEDLFSSRQASHEMPCGHAIHWHCFKELTSFDTRCPVCKKTAEAPEQMASTWSAIAMGIALQPVPPDLARLVNIICNDCEERDCERRWHFLGVRCMHCLSFNTVVEQILLQGREAAEYLDEQEAQRSGAHGVPTNIATLSLHAPLLQHHRQQQQEHQEEAVDESMNSDEDHQNSGIEDSATDLGENRASFPGMED